MVKFCDECNNILEIVHNEEESKLLCVFCKKDNSYQKNEEDAIVYSVDMSKVNDVDIKVMELIAFDPVTAKIESQCDNCKAKYTKLFAIQDYSNFYKVCPCQYQSKQQ